jgi:hypothetical protein
MRVTKRSQDRRLCCDKCLLTYRNLISYLHREFPDVLQSKSFLGKVGLLVHSVDEHGDGEERWSIEPSIPLPTESIESGTVGG